MATKPNLRAVKTDEKAEPVKPKTLTEAVASGTYLEILVAQQREIAATVGDEKGPAKAALHRQLAIISKEIQQIKAAEAEEAAEHDATEDEALDTAAI